MQIPVSSDVIHWAFATSISFRILRSTAGPGSPLLGKVLFLNNACTGEVQRSYERQALTAVLVSRAV